MKKRRVENYVKNKIALIKAENKLMAQCRGEGRISIELLNEVIRLKKTFWR